MATIILAGGHKRLLFPHARLMLHLPSTSASGDSKELEIRSKELNRVKEDLVDCYLSNGVTAGLELGTDKTKIKKKLLKDIDREFWINSNEAINYGLADSVITQDELFGDIKI
jgi:ATP-dependent Clp protease protease subunit